MPYDLSAIERGYGECDVEWQGHSIVVRYRADLNNRALAAMGDVLLGVVGMDGVTKFPDVRALIAHLQRTLLPSGPDVPEADRGWDITRDGVSLPITTDTLLDLDPGLPAAILGAIFRDISLDPKARRTFKPGSSPGAGSRPIESRIISASSSEPSATDSTPTTSPTPITSIHRPEPSGRPTSSALGDGSVGRTGTGS